MTVLRGRGRGQGLYFSPPTKPCCGDTLKHLNLPLINPISMFANFKFFFIVEIFTQRSGSSTHCAVGGFHSWYDEHEFGSQTVVKYKHHPSTRPWAIVGLLIGFKWFIVMSPLVSLSPFFIADISHFNRSRSLSQSFSTSTFVADNIHSGLDRKARVQVASGIVCNWSLVKVEL